MKLDDIKKYTADVSRMLGETRAQLLLTRFTNSRGNLTKSFWLDESGALKKETDAFLKEGVAETVAVCDLEGFAAVLSSLQANQALAYGVTGREMAEVAVKDCVHLRPGTIARSREYFAYRRGGALLMLDHDTEHVDTPIGDPAVLRQMVIDACPELEQAPMLWTASASSCIENTETGEQVRGLGGQRIYIPVVDGTDIPRAGTALYERLWLAGFGRFVVSQSGALLDRNIIDSSVFQPERLDFAAGAKCRAPLVQRRPHPIVFGNPSALFDSRKITDLTAEEKEAVYARREEARAKVADEAAKARAQYIEMSARELAAARSIDLERAVEIVTAAVLDSLLFADFLLLPESGEPVTVGQVLDNPAKWHGKRFADPTEPNYRHDRRIAWVNLRSGGRPYLHSHAHGGRRFELLRQPAAIKVQDGQESRMTDDALEVMRVHGDVFDFAHQSLVRVAGGRVTPVTAHWLRDYLGRVIRWERFDKRSKEWTGTKTPLDVANFIMDRKGERDLPKLSAVVTAPTLRADGSVLDVPGYDTASELLFLSDDPTPPKIPAAPNFDQARQAFRELWAPFSTFPFADDTARGVMVAALLTAVVRRAIPTAPGFAFDAPAAGSGKTLLATCIAALGGFEPHITPPPRDEDEARKAIFSALREGAGVLVWDNVIRPLEGAALNAFLTAETFRDRVLGQSETLACPNRTMFIVTGNNVRLVGDTCRRVLTCRIDARSETPYLRQFDFHPAARVRDQRQRLVRAALTILRHYQVNGLAFGEGRMASFEVWDDLVRQCVIWLAENGVDVGLDDPAKAALASAAEDPAKGVLDTVLRAWKSAFGDRAVLVKDAWDFAYSDSFGQTEDSAVLASELREAIDAVAGGDRQFNQRRFGMWLAKHKGEIASALFFADCEDSHAKVKRWRVESANSCK